MAWITRWASSASSSFGFEVDDGDGIVKAVEDGGLGHSVLACRPVNLHITISLYVSGRTIAKAVRIRAGVAVSLAEKKRSVARAPDVFHTDPIRADLAHSAGCSFVHPIW